MKFPADLKFTVSDEWLRVEGNTATLGVSDFAQDQLSDIVYFEATVHVGERVSQGDQVAIVESVKAAADVYTPVSGEITEVNQALAQSPELVNSDPYGGAWMVKLKLGKPSEVEVLMDRAAYQKNTEERSR
ncbi:MAG: glycine cleavage system protein GcvH [Chloroflexota bacterium]